MNYGEEIKQERSIPVQGRIDLVALANLDRYFISQGQELKTMSRLLNWGIGLVVEVLEKNNVLVDKFDNLSDANRYLEGRGLHQPGIRKRGVKKYANALTFENLRFEGRHPEDHVPRQYKVLHNKGSVKPFTGDISTGMVSNEDVEMVNRMVEFNRQKKAAGLGLRQGMSKEELKAYEEERERKVREEENASIDLSQVKTID